MKTAPIVQAHNIVSSFRKAHLREFKQPISKPELHKTALLYVNNIIATSQGKQFDHYRKVLYIINLMFKEQ